MKSYIGLVLLVVVLICSPAYPVAASAAEDIEILIDGKAFSCTPGPVLREGHVLIPMRAFFEPMGLNVEWHSESQVALAYRETIDVCVPENGDPPLINGEDPPLDTPARMIDGNLYVPLRLAAESIGLQVSWDGEQNAVLLEQGACNGAGFLGVAAHTAEREDENNTPGVSTGSFIWPLEGGGRITSPYGWRSGRFHAGVDIGAPWGTPVLASDGGTVVFSGWNGAYGRSVVIKHGRYFTRYAHHSSNLVRVGERVAQGQVIGQVGISGRATGPHLHFEIRTGGIYGPTLNPTTYISR